MKGNDDLFEKDDINMDNEFKTYYEDDEPRKKTPSFILIFLIITFGVMIALGLSFSAINLMDSNETINTLISSLTGNDNKDKFIIMCNYQFLESIIDEDFENIYNKNSKEAIKELYKIYKERSMAFNNNNYIDDISVILIFLD